MQRKIQQHVLSFCIITFLLTNSLASGDWITEKDRKVASDAQNAAAEICEFSEGVEVDEKSGRKTLERGVGGKNIMLEAMQEAKSKDELNEVMGNKVSVGWLIGRAWPLVFSFLLVFFFYICCWTACPCCKCCRCFKRVRQTPVVTKLVFLGVGGAITIGTCIAAGMAQAGYDSAVAGFDSTACAASTMVRSTLNGQKKPAFIGMIGVLEKFGNISADLAHDSTMMTKVKATLTDTQGVTDAVTHASETLKLLKDALDAVPPMIAAAEHECRFCEETGIVLKDAILALENGVGKSLSSARVEVENQLNEDSAKELQDTFNSAADPLVEVKDLIRDTFKLFTNTDDFYEIRDVLSRDGGAAPGQAVVGLIVFFAVLLCTFMMIVLLMLAFLEKCGSTEGLTGHQKPYNRFLPCTACCSWCCGWWFAILAFFVGGLFTAIGVPLSSICLTMVDMNSNLLEDVSPSLGMDFSEGETLKNIMQSCIFNKDPNANPRMLELIITNSTSGETMYDQVVGDTKDKIMGAFEFDMGAGSGLASSDSIQKLIRMLRDNDIRSLILYKKIPSNAQAPLKQAMIQSSVLCEDAVISNDIAGLAGQTIAGVGKIYDELMLYGIMETSRTSCASKDNKIQTCGGQQPICNEGNELMGFKQVIRDLATYSCATFQDPDNTALECDPYDMTNSTPSGTTVFDKTCQKDDDGTMERKPKPCGLDDFAEYIGNFAVRIELSFLRLDKVVEELGPKINMELRDTMESYIIGPITEVADGLKCGFLSHTYRGITSGLCFQGVSGFIQISESYVACGCLALIIVGFLYVIWRRSNDNLQTGNKVECEMQ